MAMNQSFRYLNGNVYSNSKDNITWHPDNNSIIVALKEDLFKTMNNRKLLKRKPMDDLESLKPKAKPIIEPMNDLESLKPTKPKLIEPMPKPMDDRLKRLNPKPTPMDEKLKTRLRTSYLLSKPSISL